MLTYPHKEDCLQFQPYIHHQIHIRHRVLQWDHLGLLLDIPKGYQHPKDISDSINVLVLPYDTIFLYGKIDVMLIFEV